MNGPQPAANPNAPKQHPLGANVQKLAEVLKFDPTVESFNGDILAEALKEITEERNKKIKVKAKEQISRAMELNSNMKKLKNQADAEIKKFDKELGKIMNQIRATMEGKTIEEATDEEDKEKAKE